MTIIKKLFFLLLSTLLFIAAAEAYGDLKVGVEDGWIWQVAVLPPSQGWDSDEGRSALGAVRYAEWKVKDSAEGVAGRDIRFIKEEPLTAENAPARVDFWRKNKISAVLSLGGDYDLEFLCPLVGEGGPVVLSSQGEEEDICPRGVPLPMVFALDLAKDFRVAAFREFGRRSLSPGTAVAILGDNFDPMLSEYADDLGDALVSLGFSPVHFWLSGSGQDSFRMIESEIIAEGAPVLVTWVGSMAVRDIWQAVKRRDDAFIIWYGGKPKKLLLSFDGIVVADQEVPLSRDGSLTALAREIWANNKTVVRDKSAAARAYGVCQWIFQGFQGAESSEPPALAKALEKAANFPLGSAMLTVNPDTHRPFVRDVAILEVKGRSFRPLDFFPVSSPGKTR